MISRSYHIVYFIGIGGIGMSALARWFKSEGVLVYGYDKTRTPLTEALESAGIPVHYEDSVELIDKEVMGNRANTLVVYTPAIPASHAELNYLKGKDFEIKKRSEVLGLITGHSFTVAVAGTHGKTTTCAMITHLLKHAGRNVTAFLGGISTNYNTNYIEGDMNAEDSVCVVEADEYDRSFLRLHPDYAVVTAMDADHLDIYGQKEALEKSFLDFLDLVPEMGHKLVRSGLMDNSGSGMTQYGIDWGEARALNISVVDGVFNFDFECSGLKLKGLQLYQPGFHNVENSVAAIKVALDLGLTGEEIAAGISSYKGVKRRFEYIIRTEQLVYVDDYAHHPVEISAFLGSLKALYPTRKLTAIFQPHLYSRTRDFVDGFAKSLSEADEVFLLEIYPAREEPIPGVSSKMIFERMEQSQKYLTTKESILSELDKEELEVLATIGAGDIDTLVEPIRMKYSQQ